MLILHDFGMEIAAYKEKGRDNDFPKFDRCPGCNGIAQGNLHRNGFYWRYGIDGEEAWYIPICRYRCLVCEVNISILPSFLIPYYQHTLDTMVERLDCVLKGKKISGSRQQIAQHLNRFCERIKWVHSFFVDIGKRQGLTTDIKKEALKYVKMIQDFGESSFFRRSWGHLSTYFMGILILPYLEREKNNDNPT